MADLTYRSENRLSTRGHTDWSAVWAGMFTFIAIWSVFGFLGYAIFASAPGAGLSLAMGVWSVILTAVAMYIGGRQTGKFAELSGRFDGAMHGMIMFGLSVVAVILLTVYGGILFTSTVAAPQMAHQPYLLSVFGGSGWLAFAGFFLGWLGAIVGASTGTSGRLQTQKETNVTNMRPAA